MNAFEPKIYQQQVLDSIKLYFEECHSFGKASTAYFNTTDTLWDKGIAYNALKGFAPEMPYFCLRIPTGGGKTWLAAKSIALSNRHLLHTQHSVILWLVPSRQIRDQTLKGLKNPNHPLNAALREAGNIEVLSLDEAKSVTRATLDTSTTVIVATRQAFQVEDTENRKVYESSGALQHHFDNITTEQKSELLTDSKDQVTPYSLANMLRLRRPFIIVDEAHNSRTDLGFDTLAKFRPSGIMELTATPDLLKTPSNVLHSVSASELKAESMIKLPIRLEAEPNWQQCLSDAIARRNSLHAFAELEQRQGENYLRPIVLIQAEPKRKGVDTRDVYAVQKELINNQNIPDDEIIIATGSEKGLEEIDSDYKLGVADPKCPVKYIITQKALAEGWDCPSAYILVSIAELHSSTSVEQLLGRILRQPNAQTRNTTELNQSYAFVVSRSFTDTAKALRDRLVEGAGFERKNVQDFVQASLPKQQLLDLGSGQVRMKPVVLALQDKPDLKKVSKSVKSKVSWDNSKKTITITQPLSVEEGEELMSSVESPVIQNQIVKAAEVSRTTALEHFRTPAESGEIFAIPQMAVMIQGELQLFDDPEALDYPWELSLYDAHPSKDQIEALNLAFKVNEGGEIDITDEGKLRTSYIKDLQRDLGLAYKPEHWDQTKVSNWICSNLPDDSTTHASKMAFVASWTSSVLDIDEYSLARLNQQKFQIRNLLEQHIKDLRKKAITGIYQQTLFGADTDSLVVVNDSYNFTFNPQVYSPNSYYDPTASELGYYEFSHHYYGQIGEFDSKEEFACACWLDQQAAKGRIQFWVRNLVNKEGCSFFLQKATGRFFPDFVCKLADGSLLVVEYKGADRWSNPKVEADRAIGELWAAQSGGKCQFIMLTDQRWEMINELL